MAYSILRTNCVAVDLFVSTPAVIPQTDIVNRLYHVLFYTRNSLIVIIKGYFKDLLGAYLDAFLTAIALVGVDDYIVFA